jgi:hypothetical protein
MKLFLNVNLIMTKILWKFQLKSGLLLKCLILNDSVCLFVRLFVCFNFLSLLPLDKLLILIFSFLNTETKDWHQKFLQIVLRNLLNWWKCVGRNNLNSVLYPLSLFFVFVSFILTQSQNSTIWLFFLYSNVMTGFWNNLWNVEMIDIHIHFSMFVDKICFLFVNSISD